MPEFTPARLLQVHITEQDRAGDRPLYQAIVEKCRELGIAGATVFRGLEGYGGAAEVHRHHLLGSDLPIIVTVVDTAENIARLAPEVERLAGRGVIAIWDVSMRRVRK